MARRYILTMKEIQKRRANNWAFHYAQRELVKQAAASLDIPYILAILMREIPPPELLIDASLLHGIAEIKGIDSAIKTLHWNYTQREIACIWYWTPEHWQSFVRAFQTLPEPASNYYYAYDEEKDALRFVPDVKGKVWGKSGESLGKVGQVSPVWRERRSKKRDPLKVSLKTE